MRQRRFSHSVAGDPDEGDGDFDGGECVREDVDPVEE